MRLLPLALLLGCGSAPQTLQDCAGLAGATEREDCRLEMLVPLFEAGDMQAFEQGLATLEEPVSRDLVRLRLAVADPSKAGHLCRGVETDDARTKCKQVLGRPHLAAPRDPGQPGQPPRPPGQP